MSVVQSDILKGLWEYLTTNNDFNDLLGGNSTNPGRIWYWEVAREEEMPYCVYQLIDTSEMMALGLHGFDYRIQFSIFSPREGGVLAITAIGDALRAHLHWKTLTFDNHHAHDAREFVLRGPFLDEGEVWRLDLEYLIQGFET